MIRFDPTFGIKTVALAIAQFIRADVDAAYVTWAPHYNGREKGIALAVRRDFSGPALVVIWGENRSSDDIYVTSYLHGGFCDPTDIHVTEEVYDRRRYFKHYDIKAAADFISNIVAVYIAQGVFVP